MRYDGLRTQEEVDLYLAKFNKASNNFDLLPIQADEGPESNLQKKIVKWARDWGHPCLSFRQSKKLAGLIPEGWPDICLILPNARVLFIELKSGKGRLSEAQKMMRLQFISHGFVIHEVRSYKRFLGLVEGK